MKILKTIVGYSCVFVALTGVVFLITGWGLPQIQEHETSFQIALPSVVQHVSASEPTRPTSESSETSQETTEETTSQTTTSPPDESGLPAGNPSDWNLVLINRQHPMTNFDVDLVTLPNGLQLDRRIVPYWDKLYEAAKQAGISLTMVSAFRSVATQQALIQQNIQQNINSGMNEEDARAATMRVMQDPKTSEHTSGLAFDVVGTDYFNRTPSDQLLTANFANDPSAKWLAENAARFGFILRYPQNRFDITGIDFEPWHFRFVGIPAAEYIKAHNITLEEYIEMLSKAGR